MKKITTVSMLSAIAIMAGCNQQQTSTAPEVGGSVNKAAIKAHVEFLADDLLKGRDTGSEGYEIAARYVASQFKQFGLAPMGDDGSYYQQVNLRQAFLDQNSPEFSINGEAIDYPKDFLMGANVAETESAVEGETVFVGYGIVAPTQNHDDYAGMDVEGKIVVILPGKPKDFPSEEGAHLSSGREKSKYA